MIFPLAHFEVFPRQHFQPWWCSMLLRTRSSTVPWWISSRMSFLAKSGEKSDEIPGPRQDIMMPWKTTKVHIPKLLVEYAARRSCQWHEITAALFNFHSNVQLNRNLPKKTSKHIKPCYNTHTHAYTHIHTYIHTYLRTYVHTFIHSYIHSYIHTCIHACMHAYIHTYIHSYIHACIHTFLPTYLHTYVRTYVHSFIHTFIHSYIHTLRVLPCSVLPP